MKQLQEDAMLAARLSSEEQPQQRKRDVKAASKPMGSMENPIEISSDTHSLG